MPLYEFECASCGAKAERQLKMANSDEPQGCCEIVSACDVHAGYDDNCVTCTITRECAGKLNKIMPSAQSARVGARFTPGWRTKDGKKIPTKRPKGLGDY